MLDDNISNTLEGVAISSEVVEELVNERICVSWRYMKAM